MPDAATMRDVYADQIRRVHSQGKTEHPEECRLGRIWLALFDLVNDDLKAATECAA
jgi:hypothetical protein